MGREWGECVELPVQAELLEHGIDLRRQGLSVARILAASGLHQPDAKPAAGEAKSDGGTRRATAGHQNVDEFV
jgi:hypothetical protein